MPLFNTGRLTNFITQNGKMHIMYISNIALRFILILDVQNSLILIPSNLRKDIDKNNYNKINKGLSSERIYLFSRQVNSFTINSLLLL